MPRSYTDYNKWNKQATSDELAGFVNKSSNCIKVLAAEDFPMDSKEEKQKLITLPKKCEGVFVYRLDGDDDNGIGILLSNIRMIEHLAMRGDLVQYRTLTPENKPYITQFHDGSGS
jgi:hypothetical protein